MSHNNSYGNLAGSYLNECLPNITGDFIATERYLTDNPSAKVYNGAFYSSKYYYGYGLCGACANLFDRKVDFDASRIGYYKTNCKAVRPSTYVVYMWVRTS